MDPLPEPPVLVRTKEFDPESEVLVTTSNFWLPGVTLMDWLTEGAAA